MNIKINELMTASVISTEKHKSIGHVRQILERNRIGAIPVVGADREPVGIVSANDLVATHKDSSPVSTIMSNRVVTVPRYDDASTAARVMRNHKIHHLLVTHEHRIVGVLSSFDLLKLVESHRYVAKNPPTPSRRKAPGRV